MADTITNEELQAQIQDEVKAVIVESSKVIKQYIDDNSIKNEVERAKLTDEISQAIAEKYDFASEAEKLEKANQVAETLLGLFDTDESGTIEPQEFLDKLNSIYSQLETTNQLSEDLQGLVTSVANLQSYIDTKIGEVNGAISTLNSNVSKNQADITAIQADLSVNYFTKEDVSNALTINKDEIIDEVKNIFGVNTEEDGDGATL